MVSIAECRHIQEAGPEVRHTNSGHLAGKFRSQGGKVNIRIQAASRETQETRQPIHETHTQTTQGALMMLSG